MNILYQTKQYKIYRYNHSNALVVVDTTDNEILGQLKRRILDEYMDKQHETAK